MQNQKFLKAKGFQEFFVMKKACKLNMMVHFFGFVRVKFKCVYVVFYIRKGKFHTLF